MPRKIRNGAKRPPLSTLDKTLYFFLFVITFFLTLVLSILLTIEIPFWIAYSNPQVVATANESVPIAALLFSFIVGMGSNLLVFYGWKCRQPLFGNPNYKPKLFEPTAKVYPLFSKQFLQDRTEKQRARIRKFARIATAVILILALLTPLSFCKRTDLTENLQFVSYDSFNTVEETRDMRDAEKLIIRIVRTTAGRGRRNVYHIKMNFVYSDETYSFPFGRFRGLHWGGEATLQQMLYLKSFFEGRYALEGVDRIERLCRKFSNAERELIYELFDYAS